MTDVTSVTADDVIERLRFVQDQGGGYSELAEDCIVLVQRQREAVEKVSAEYQRKVAEASPDGERFGRIVIGPAPGESVAHRVYLADPVDQELERLRSALAGLSNAVAHMRVPQTLADAALQVTVTIGPALRRAQEVLAGSPDQL